MRRGGGDTGPCLLAHSTGAAGPGSVLGYPLCAPQWGTHSSMGAALAAAAAGAGKHSAF